MDASPFLIFGVIIAAAGYVIGRLAKGEENLFKRTEEVFYAIGLVSFLLSAFF